MKTGRWWAFLCVLAVVNIAAWSLAAAMDEDPSRLQILLSGIYVFGCAYRSFLPVYDIPRICLVDSFASSVLVGRSVATLAELAFAAQWAVFLQDSSLEGVRLVSAVIVPLIVIAELCSWHAVLTTNNLGHVFENSLWGISAGLIVASLIAVASQFPASRTPALGIWVIGGMLYVAYIFLTDVPMYWSRWKTDGAQRRQYLGLAQGIVDVTRRRQVSRAWEDWRSEVTWMTLYFSTGVWTSIMLIHAGS